MAKKRLRPKELIERNAAATVAINDRLEAALEKLRADRSIPATRASVAELAKCSPGTVNNRSSVVDALRDIKHARKKGKPAASEPLENDPVQEIKELKEKLAKSRDANLGLLNERDAMKRKYDKVSKNYQSLAEKYRDLQGTLPGDREELPSTVVPLRPKPPSR